MRDGHDGMDNAAGDRILPLWRQMCEEGTEFFVDGEVVPLTAVIARTVREDGIYMADYVLGEEGKIEQVRFDRVKPD